MMGKIKFMLPFLALMTACSPKVVKMNFVKNNDRGFEQILADAKKNKKLVFVDVYTTWCGPCKWMDENTFTNTEVAQQFNKKFINYKVDAESPIGVNLAAKYRVESYPSYFFLDVNGKVLKRMEGMMYPKMLLEEMGSVKN